jgi:hypothetical protein
MREVNVITACKNYRTTLDKFEELAKLFEKDILQHGIGIRDASTDKTKSFLVLSEIVEASISPAPAAYIMGKIEFNLIIDPLAKPIEKKRLLQLHLDENGGFGLELSSSGHLTKGSDLEDVGTVTAYVTKAVLQEMLKYFDINTF